MISAGQAAVSCDLVSGQADTAPASAPACAGDVCRAATVPKAGAAQGSVCAAWKQSKTSKEQMSKPVTVDRIRTKGCHGCGLWGSPVPWGPALAYRGVWEGDKSLEEQEFGGAMSELQKCCFWSLRHVMGECQPLEPHLRTEELHQAGCEWKDVWCHRALWGLWRELT